MELNDAIMVSSITSILSIGCGVLFLLLGIKYLLGWKPIHKWVRSFKYSLWLTIPFLLTLGNSIPLSIHDFIFKIEPESNIGLRFDTQILVIIAIIVLICFPLSILIRLFILIKDKIAARKNS